MHHTATALQTSLPIIHSSVSWNMSLSNEAINSTLETMFNSNSTDNGSSLANTTHPGVGRNPFEDFYKAAFGSSIFMFVSLLVTILANSLLLLVLCIDPLKIFRNATTYFLIGLAIVDLLTGLVQEPIYATCFMFLYLQHPSRKKCVPFMNAGRYFGAFTMTASFLIVLAFTVTQYIVVASPLKYGRLVTKKKVLISLAVIYLYSATFWCLHLMGVSSDVQAILDLSIHSYLSALATIAIYILLHLAMKKKMAAGNTLQGKTGAQDNGKHIQVQRNFVRVNFMLLAVLIVCNTPGAVFYTVLRFINHNASSPNHLIVNLIMDNLLYLKILLDPFVYAWRMPKYRESLSKTIRRKNICRETSGNENGDNELAVGENHGRLSTAELNRSAITLLSFRYVEEPIARPF